MPSTPSLVPMESNENPELLPWTKHLHRKASRVHSKVPYINKLPFSAVAIIVLLILINIAAWIVAIIALVRFVQIIRWQISQG